MPDCKVLTLKPVGGGPTQVAEKLGMKDARTRRTDAWPVGFALTFNWNRSGALIAPFSVRAPPIRTP